MYLDNAATTKIKDEVLDAMMPYLTEQFYNPSSLYSESVKVKEAVDNARSTVGEFIGSKPNEIYFTSGGSEANSWAIQGFVNSRLNKKRLPYIITTDIEHKSILDCVKNQTLATKYHLGVDYEGYVSKDELNDAIALMINSGANPTDILVSIQFANNEVGSIQNIEELSEVAHMYGCVFHTDAVQAFGQLKINVNDMGIDMLTASAHKIGGAKGTGFLYIKNKIRSKYKFAPLVYGSQMGNLRGGTENVAGIVGMAKAVELIKDKWKDGAALAMTRDYFINKLIVMGCDVNGAVPTGDDGINDRLPNNVNVILPDGVAAENLLYALDSDGVEIGTGSACNSKSVKPSHVLKAMHKTDDECSRSIRITIPDDMTMSDVDEVIETIDKNIAVLKSIG